MRIYHEYNLTKKYPLPEYLGSYDAAKSETKTTGNEYIS